MCRCSNLSQNQLSLEDPLKKSDILSIRCVMYSAQELRKIKS